MVVDLLWNARQPPATAGLLHRDGSEPLAATDTSIMGPLDLQDVMVERIRGSVGVSFTSATGTQINASMTHGISTDTGANIGKQFGIEGLDYDVVAPNRWPASVMISWSLYETAFLFGPQYTAGQIGTGGRMCVLPIDVRSRRRLKDWGDNLYWVGVTSGIGPVTDLSVVVTTSTLISHRG